MRLNVLLITFTMLHDATFSLYDFDKAALRKLSNGRFKPGTSFASLIILRTKHELTSKAASKSVLLRLFQVGPPIIAKDRSYGPVLWIVLWTLKTIKLRMLFQRDTNNCKEIMISPCELFPARSPYFFQVALATAITWLATTITCWATSLGGKTD